MKRTIVNSSESFKFNSSRMKRDKIRMKGSDNNSLDRKPFGLWYGFGKNWLNWSGRNRDKKEYIHEIEINDLNIFKISNDEGLSDFSKKYAATGLSSRIYGTDTDVGIGSEFFRHSFINWKKVSDEYDGIEINPRMMCCNPKGEIIHWYYGWDVASGCVWNSDCFSKVINTSEIFDVGFLI